MKVSELMAILAKCNPEAEVVMPDGIPLTYIVQVEEIVVLSDYCEEEDHGDYGSHELLEHNGRYWE